MENPPFNNPVKEKEEDIFLTSTQVAKKMNISRQTVHNWRRMGTAPKCVRFGRAWLYLSSDVEKFILDKMEESQRP